MAKKIFVLDTNVILHNHKAMYAFADNDIVIPIAVLEELDKFKKDESELGWNARQFMRDLDKISDENIFTHGVELGEGRGKIFVKTLSRYPEILQKSFVEQIPDHRILATAVNMKEELHDLQEDTPVILVSKDINLRMKSKSIGVPAEDFENDKIENLDLIEDGVRVIPVASAEIINKFYAKHATPQFSPEEIGIARPENNEYFFLRYDNSRVMVYYNPFTNKVERVDKTYASGIEPRNSEQSFALHALTDDSIKLIALTGTAGTGKTLLALAAALQVHENYEQILLARPIVAMGNKEMGYLPGNEKDKIRPYMLPLFDNLQVIKQNLIKRNQRIADIDAMLDNGKLEISPLAYIRGRSLSKVYFIIDEAQNLTPHEVKTIITRAGEGTKIVFTGDIQQIDSPYLDSLSNGLSHLSAKMKGQKPFASINLVKGERSELSELASTLL
ncbi:MAG: PhoH family protein [Bacteroidales bacterium]|jgi:PhoH-like ATPase|nr:PhoH family protein [Bacteroidales bacterium]